MNPVITAHYMGRNYMVIEGSPRHHLIVEADKAARAGHHDLARQNLNSAIAALGCPFEARENRAIQQHDSAQFERDCRQFARVNKG